MKKTELTKKIREKALAEGFDLVGFVAPERMKAEGRHLTEWLSQGLHGEMKWLERDPEKRSDPQILFPGAKSVIALAVNYYSPEAHPDDPEKGKISRYAWGDDYHDVIKEKLWELLNWIKERVYYRSGDCSDDRKIVVVHENPVSLNS